MTKFDHEQHLIKGDADAARSWIQSSALPEDQKADLLQFVANFSSLTFVKEDDAILDHYAETDRVALPAWLREVRSTLAFVDPPMLLQVDDFQWYNSPRSDDVDDIWYQLRFGYHGEEQRTLFFEDAKIYRIGVWWGTDESYLGVDLHAPGDQRIFDFSGADLRDNKLARRPVRGSLYPVFESYAQLLAHVAEVQPLDAAL
ncbi:hypothetical protein ABZS86_25255 [Streptomyces sp. NPDC005355]|uniref:hypothetical protein n=1 Tax=Streptomyces sp. NPDC005355 TaxID=3157038 RepID=UPI0033A7630B